MKCERGDPDFDLATEINEYHLSVMEDNLPLNIQIVATWIHRLRAPGLRAQQEAEDLIEELQAQPEQLSDSFRD